MLYNLLKKSINYLFPTRCFCCASITEFVNGLCPECWVNIEYITAPHCRICGSSFILYEDHNKICNYCIIKTNYFDSSISLFKFRGKGKEIIHNFKYYDTTELSCYFAKKLYNMHKNILFKSDLIIPVPMHRLKRLYRLYNPAFLLGLDLSKTLNIKLSADIIIKKYWTKSQTYLNKIERQQNLENTFIINKVNDLINRNVLLVDDVYTTGATANIISKLLKIYGAKNIILVTIAKNIL